MGKKAKERKLFIPQQQSHWVTYVEEGFEDDPTQVEVLLRRNLSLEEVQTLSVPDVPEGLKGEELEAAIEERNQLIYAALAPFVLDWNMGYLTPSGEAVMADPPAVAGPGQFPRFLGQRFTSQIYFDLLRRNTGLVKAARSTPLERTANTSGASSETPTGTEAT